MPSGLQACCQLRDVEVTPLEQDNRMVRAAEALMEQQYRSLMIGNAEVPLPRLIGSHACLPARTDFQCSMVRGNMKQTPPRPELQKSVEPSLQTSHEFSRKQDQTLDSTCRARLLRFYTKHGFRDVNTSNGFFSYVYPLHAAVQDNDGFMLELLIRLRADPESQDSKGRTCMDLAQQLGSCMAHQILSAISPEVDSVRGS